MTLLIADDTILASEQLLRRIVKRFRGGLVFKANRLCVSLNSRIESKKEGEGVSNPGWGGMAQGRTSPPTQKDRAREREREREREIERGRKRE